MRAWRRWRALGEVERVGLYTRQSLYVVLVVFNAATLVTVALAHEDAGEAVTLVTGGAIVTALAIRVMVAVLRSFPAAPPPPPGRVLALGLACVAFGSLIAATVSAEELRGAALSTVMASLTLALALLPGRRTAVSLIALAALLGAVFGGAPESALAGALLVVALLVTARVSLWILGVVTDLDTARRAQAQLAVAEERLRFSRDVHDVLGRRLSTIAVQAELAATLAQRGDDRAAGRMLEVRGVAHEALREAREMARGYRATDVLHELEGARSLLRSAGIELRGSVDGMPRAWHEAGAWVVRESITNVLRHSNADVVTVTYAGGELRVENDHAHPEGSADGSGLRSLLERLAPLGATLHAGPTDDGGWAVVAQLPAGGPLSAIDAAGALP